MDAPIRIMLITLLFCRNMVFIKASTAVRRDSRSSCIDRIDSLSVLYSPLPTSAIGNHRKSPFMSSYTKFLEFQHLDVVKMPKRYRQQKMPFKKFGNKIAGMHTGQLFTPLQPSFPQPCLTKEEDGFIINQITPRGFYIDKVQRAIRPRWLLSECKELKITWIKHSVGILQWQIMTPFGRLWYNLAFCCCF